MKNPYISSYFLRLKDNTGLKFVSTATIASVLEIVFTQLCSLAGTEKALHLCWATKPFQHTGFQTALVMHSSNYDNLKWCCPFLIFVANTALLTLQCPLFVCFLFLLRCNWQGLVRWNFSGNPLHWQTFSTQPIQSEHSLGRECGNGGAGQPATGFLCPFWTDLCIVLGLPQVHEKHLPLYSTGHAKPGQRWAETQNSIFEESTICLKQGSEYHWSGSECLVICNVALLHKIQCLLLALFDMQVFYALPLILLFYSILIGVWFMLLALI